MTISLRPATPADATHMAALVNLAGAGLPATLWLAQADYGQDPMEVGRARASRDEGAFSWRNADIAEVDGRVAGMVITYLRGDEDDVVDSTTHPVFRPLIRLENAAPDTRYVNVLAVFPQYQRKGVGRQLMAHAEEEPGPKGMSLIMKDDDADVRAFYEAMGYVEAARLPIVKANWVTRATDWVLMRKP